jgi:hypothetical protein
MGSRQVKLLCLRHDGVVQKLDCGHDATGTPTGQRQALLRCLKKTTDVDGRKIPTFVLAEPITVILDPNDPLDQSLRDNVGRWMLPSKEWLAIRDTFLAQEQQARDAAADRLQREASAAVATQLVGLVDKAAQQMSHGGKATKEARQ